MCKVCRAGFPRPPDTQRPEEGKAEQTYAGESSMWTAFYETAYWTELKNDWNTVIRKLGREDLPGPFSGNRMALVLEKRRTQRTSVSMR